MKTKVIIIFAVLLVSYQALSNCEIMEQLSPFRNYSVLVKSKPIVGLKNKIRKISDTIRIGLTSNPTLLDLIPEAELQPLIQSSVASPKSFILKNMYGDIVPPNGHYHVFMNPKGELMVGDQILPESLVPSAISSMALVNFEDGRIESIHHIAFTSEINQTPEKEVDSLLNLLKELKARGFTKEDFALPDKTVFRLRATSQILKVMGLMNSFEATYNKTQMMRDMGLDDPRAIEISYITNRRTTLKISSHDALRFFTAETNKQIESNGLTIQLNERNLSLLP